jgi:hypothetical protein
VSHHHPASTFNDICAISFQIIFFFFCYKPLLWVYNIIENLVSYWWSSWCLTTEIKRKMQIMLPSITLNHVIQFSLLQHIHSFWIMQCCPFFQFKFLFFFHFH